MPTPFYHLSVAADLLRHPDLSSEARDLLQNHRGAFLLGNTAPDVQTVSGQDRQATHFFDLPILPGTQPAWDRFIAVHPSLGQPARLPPDQTAFLAGYLCHLQADWLWVVQIFFPVFGPDCAWQTFRERLYLHNVLRAYLDRQIIDSLDAAVGSDLQGATPRNWLPFVADDHLLVWRNLLARQLQPGSTVETVEVFASRQGISPEAYYRLLSSEEKLEEEIFVHLPRRNLQAYREGLIIENLSLLQTYWSGEKIA